MRRCSQTAQTARAGELSEGFGVRVNPAKSATFTVAAGDRVVVLADS